MQIDLKKHYLLYHILSWSFLYMLWIGVFQNRTLTLTRSLTVEFCYLIFIAAGYYLITYVLVPNLLQKKGYVRFAFQITLILLSLAFLRSQLALFMNANVFMVGKQGPNFLKVFENSFLNIGIWVSVLTCAKMLWDRMQHTKYVAALEHEKALTELSFLRAQINPHFLFNSLNSVYGQIDKTNKTARVILLKLSEMLRYQLYDCNVERVQMSKELEYIRNYVSLQQYRKEEDLVVEMDIDQSLENLSIAPLIMVVFIENAFKHVSNFDEKPNQIIIKLSRLYSCIQFQIWNTRDEQQQNALISKNGIGISNVKRRLELLYPQKHELLIKKTSETYEVNLKIDLT